MNSIRLFIDCLITQQEIQEYCAFLHELLETEITVSAFAELIENEDAMLRLARTLAEIRVTQLDNQELNATVFPVEIEYEKNHLFNSQKSSQCLYSGYEYQNILRKEWPSHFAQKNILSIVLTDRRFLTWETDCRYHLRTVILGYPCILSRVGIVEAPAKPKEYYLLKHIGASIELQNWLSANRHRYLELEDTRMTEVIKGYLFQCFYFWIHYDNEFCDNSNCVLYNSHWQEEVLNAQFNHYLCPKHQLDKIPLS